MEERIAHRAGRDKINFATEQVLEILKQSEVAIGRVVRTQLREIDQEVEIAGDGIEICSGSGAEQIQSPDAVASAELHEFLATLFDYLDQSA